MKLLSTMSFDEKNAVIQQWRDFIKSLDPKKSGDLIKIDLLTQVVEYAAANLNAKFFSFVAASRYDTCNAIFSARELPPIFFTHYVVRQLKSIPEENSKLRDSMLGLAQGTYDLLLVPYENQIRKIAGFCAMTLVSLAFYNPTLMPQYLFFTFVLASVFYAAPQIANFRVEKALKDIMASPYNMNQLGDGMDDILCRIENTSMKLGTASLTLLSNTIERSVRLGHSSMTLLSDGIERGAQVRNATGRFLTDASNASLAAITNTANRVDSFYQQLRAPAVVTPPIVIAQPPVVEEHDHDDESDDFSKRWVSN